jgi:O-antigen/teichoic acid export membrane protein
MAEPVTPSATPSAPPQHSRVVRNVVSNWGAFAFGAVVNFVLAPFVVHRLGNAAYGVWILLVSLVGYLGLLDLGVRGAVTRYVARFHSAGDHEHAGRVASTALAAFAAAGLAAVGASAVLALVVNRAFHVPESLAAEARVVVLLSGINIAVSLVSGVFGGVVVGRQRFDYINGVEMGVGALRAVAIVVALKLGFGLVALALVQLGTTAVRGVAGFWLARALYPELHIELGRWDRDSLRLLFSYGITSSLVQAMGSLILYSDSIVIGAFLPVGMITFFAIAASLTDYGRSLVSGISQTLTPMASALEVRGRGHELERAQLNGARIATLVVLPVVLTFLLRGGSFIGLWMGPAYVEQTGSILRVLSVTLWTIASFQVVTATMMGVGKHGGLVPILLAEGAGNLGLSLLWIHPFGLLGVAWGTTVPRLAVTCLIAPWYVRRTLGTPLRTFWRTVFLRPALAALPFALGSYAIERLWPAPNLLVYFAQVAGTLPLALLGAWFVGLSAAERRGYAQSFARPLRRAFAR